MFAELLARSSLVVIVNPFCVVSVRSVVLETFSSAGDVLSLISHSGIRVASRCFLSVACGIPTFISYFLFFIWQISGACVISGLYCEGALVLANIGDCQAVYHGHVKGTLGSPITAQTVSFFIILVAQT